MRKRILGLSDFHCGHVIGLTHPDYFNGDRRIRAIQKECFDHFLQARGDYDAVVLNGDQIDGKGEKSGGCEQWTTDRKKQAECAVECVKAVIKNKRTPIFSTYGTGYHVGNSEDFEDLVVTGLQNDGYNAQACKSHLWLEMEGVMFDFKHHCGSSGIPHGRHTAQAKERLWNVLWSERGQCPKANVIVRSHVHYYSLAGGPEWVAMTTPALQGLGSKFGERRCSGIVDYGYTTFYADNGRFDWDVNILQFEAQKDKAIAI